LQKKLTKQIRNHAKKNEFEKAQIIKLTLKKLEYILTKPSQSQFLQYSQSQAQILENLVNKLNYFKLTHIPKRIECFDIAHLQQTNQVGSMSVLIDGQIDTSKYRRFIIDPYIKGDPHALAHIISRRLKHKEWPAPDLIILDGGRSQLSIVSKIIPKHIPTLAISKKHEIIHYYNADNKIINLSLPLGSSSLQLIQLVRDEAHRFGTKFHKLRRNKAFIFDT